MTAPQKPPPAAAGPTTAEAGAGAILPAMLPGRIDSIVVFRALMLGDLLCATPALRALRAAFPKAQIVYVGLPWAETLVGRLRCVDDFIPFPGYPGLPERDCDAPELPRFFARLQSRRFDLALQMHGSGPIVNPLVQRFRARLNAGFAATGVWVPPGDAERFVAWPESGSEIERMLMLTDRLGVPRQGLELDFPIHAQDRDDAQRALGTLPGDGAYVCVHAGAQLPSRRWHASRFAEVADHVASSGRTVVLTGSTAEADVVGQVAAAMRSRSLNLCGRTTLGMLGALIEGAQFVVCNDTGISHIAAALRRPSVVVSSGADVSRWAPLDRRRHAVLWHDVPCRPCSHALCPTAHECAAGVPVTHVMQAVGQTLGAAAA